MYGDGFNDVLAVIEEDCVKVESIDRAIPIVGYKIHSIGVAIDYRRSQDAHHGEHVIVAIFVLVRDGCSVAALPQNRSVVGVNCVDAVVFSGHVDHVVDSLASDRLLHQHQRFCVHPAIEGNRLQSAE